MNDLCHYCQEVVAAGEQDDHYEGPMHYACGYRLAAGSLAHIEGRCSCYVPGSTEGDPPGLTKRQAAQAAFDAATKTFKRSVKAMLDSRELGEP